MDKRYQVFLSSTYADLKEERRAVMQALMEMDCIPAGMEMFPASDEEQFDFIKTVIDDCDYYVIIVGARYGSTTAEGISYTEKEYEYAKSKNIRVLAFLHGNPDEIPFGKSEPDPALRAKLTEFRECLKTNRLVKFWKSAAELPGMVALSLQKEIKIHPAVGWVRANSVATEEHLVELNELRKQNAELKARIAETTLQDTPVVDNLAGLDEEFTLEFSYLVNPTTRAQGEVNISWRSIFALIAPHLLAPLDEHDYKNKIQSIVLSKYKYAHITDYDYQTIKIQLGALNLIAIDYCKTVAGTMALFVSLTPYGKRLLVEERTIKARQEA